MSSTKHLLEVSITYGYNLREFMWILEQSPHLVNKQLFQGTWTPLHAAAYWNRFEMCKLLLYKFKADPNIENNNQLTPMYYACMRGNIDICKLLLNYDKRVLEFKEENWNFFYVCTKDPAHMNICRFLIENNYAPDNIYTETALIRNDFEIFKLLLDYGIDLSCVSKNNTNVFEWIRTKEDKDETYRVCSSIKSCLFVEYYGLPIFCTSCVE